MSDHPKQPANKMFRAAVEVMKLLADVCDRLEIGGSLRRDKVEISDVELVMRPKYAQRPKDLFGNTEPVNLLEERCAELLAAKAFQKRVNKNGVPIAWGKPGEDARYKAIWFGNVPVDLFIVLPDRQWGPTMLIRTGPGDANQILVTQEGIKNREGLWGILPKGMSFDDGALWQNFIKLDTPEEADVFAAMDMPYIPPPYRSIEAYQKCARRRDSLEPALRGTKFESLNYGYHEFKVQFKPSQTPTSSTPTLQNGLDVATGLVLQPQDFVGEHVGILGMTGMGKSNLVATICEEVAPTIPMTIIDIEGEYHSLREVYPFLVVGRAAHVDRVVDFTHAEALAEEVLNDRLSVILDFTDFEDEERHEFVRLYLDRLFNLEGKLKRPHMVVFEEAAEYFHQRRKSEVSRVAARVAARGRKRGIGLILASQRPASVDKEVLNMCKTLFLLGQQFAHEIKAYSGMLPSSFNAEAAIRNLSQGQAIVRQKGIDGKYRAGVYNIRRRRTTDLGKTPELESAIAVQPTHTDLVMEARIKRLEKA